MNYQRKHEEAPPSPLTDNNLIQLLENHFQLLQDTLGENKDVEFPLPHYSPDLAYTLAAKLVEVGSQKELTKARLDNLNAVLDSKLEETVLGAESAKQELDTVNQEGEERDALLHPDKQDTINYTLQILKDKLARLKEIHGTLNIVDTPKLETLLAHHTTLISKDIALSQRLEKLSSNRTLPPNYALAEAKVAERKEYLVALKHQIGQLQDMNSDVSSVFDHSKFN